MMTASTQDQTTDALFARLSEQLFNELHANECMTLSLQGENVSYLRFNHAKIRQITQVTDAAVQLEFLKGQRLLRCSFQLTDASVTQQFLTPLLDRLRKQIELLPEDPYAVEPSTAESSRAVFKGKLPDNDTFCQDFLGIARDLDIVGIHQSGTSYCGVANSKGLKHWFETEGFASDYSIFHKNGKAVKGTLAGKDWDTAAVFKKMQNHREVFQRLDREPIRLAPGKYRSYLEPDATADLLGMLSYRGVSEAALRQGDSGLALLSSHSGAAKRLSEKFSVTEDFSLGLVPRFNENGELAAMKQPIMSKGEFVSSLINPRTAKEYGLQSNGANSDESLRSPIVASGTLEPSAALAALGTGIYVSNLHYLNWSDVPKGRVTGMTRYACMWVENGQFVSPIVDLRFDDSLLELFGYKLESLSSKTELIPNVGSYGGRNLGGMVVPGVLINDFTYTL